MSKEAFLDLLESENKKLNLISYKTREELEVKHWDDSLALLEVLELPAGQRVMDLGTGGGFPGIPLAIQCPQAEFVLVDSVGKKVKAVEGMAKTLKLRNVKVLNARFEELGWDPAYRERFGLVVARAVAALPTLLEYAAPFVCVHGMFLAYKSRDYLEELEASKKAQSALGLEFDGAVDYELAAPPKGGAQAESMGSRSLLIFRKVRALGKEYPRRVGVAGKRPIG